MVSIADLVELYKLEPHPEGGFYHESYRSTENVITNLGHRKSSTGIFFLLPQNTKSHLHRISSDEMWHFYLGGSMTIFQISTSGQLELTVLGPDIKQGQKLQHVVPAGHWFGAMADKGSEYSFVGCTVAPGFEFEDFDLGKRSELIELYPEHEVVIKNLTSGV